MSRSRKEPSGRGRGRPKGSRNKVTNEVKDAILETFRRLGGVDAMVKWVEADPANKAIFYGRILLRVMPRPPMEVTIEPEQPAPVKGALVWEKPTFPPHLPPETAVARVVEALKASNPPPAAAEPGEPGWVLCQQPGRGAGAGSPGAGGAATGTGAVGPPR